MVGFKSEVTSLIQSEKDGKIITFCDNGDFFKFELSLEDISQ